MPTTEGRCDYEAYTCLRIHHCRCRIGRSPKSNFQPLSVAILNPSGHLVTFKREDRSGIIRFEIAFGKAYGVLGVGFGSRELANRAPAKQEFIAALTVASDGRLIPAPSGVLIVSEGDIIGAVGISGDESSDNNESCAVAGIKTAGLETKVGLIE